MALVARDRRTLKPSIKTYPKSHETLNEDSFTLVVRPGKSIGRTVYINYPHKPIGILGI